MYPKLKMNLKGLNFADFVEIQKAVNDELKKVPKKKNFLEVFIKCTTAKILYIYQRR